MLKKKGTHKNPLDVNSNSNTKHPEYSSSTLQQYSPRGGSQEEETISNTSGTTTTDSEGEELVDNDNDNGSDNNIGIVQAQYSLPDNNNEHMFDDENQSCTQGLILMDGFCPYHGGYLSHKAKIAYNAGIVHTLSDYVSSCLSRDDDDEDNDDDDMDYTSARMPKTKDDIKMWLDSIPFDIVGIICESDSGLDDAEKLGVAIGLCPERHDGYNKARRDKFLMNQVVGDHGLRVVRQQFCSTLDEALAFAHDDLNVPSTDSSATTSSIPSSPEINIERNKRDDERLDIDDNTGLLGKGTNIPTAIPSDANQEEKQQTLSLLSSSAAAYCVVKPCRGVASDDVYFCTNLQDVEEAFQKIHHTPVFGCAAGETHESVLIQEFAKGTEYVIDIVSKNGEHKVAALWRYDKRPANNAPFVYFATEIINAQTETGRQVCEYAMKALDALDLKWGLTHVEVILDSPTENGGGSQVEGDDSGPVLVEVNCRQHNTDFVPLTSMSIGYNALDMLLSAYLGDNINLSTETEHLRLEWDQLPHLSKPRAFAAIVHLVNYVEGEVIGFNENVLNEMQNLPSVLAMEIYDHFSVGNIIGKTIDIRSDSGWIHLMNDDEEQFIMDYNRIVELMPTMFIVE